MSGRVLAVSYKILYMLSIDAKKVTPKNGMPAKLDLSAKFGILLD